MNLVFVENFGVSFIIFMLDLDAVLKYMDRLLTGIRSDVEFIRADSCHY